MVSVSDIDVFVFSVAPDGATEELKKYVAPNNKFPTIVSIESPQPKYKLFLSKLRATTPLWLCLGLVAQPRSNPFLNTLPLLYKATIVILKTTWLVVVVRLVSGLLYWIGGTRRNNF